MENNAMTFRAALEANFDGGRLSANEIGNKDYAALTALYRTALDCLTEWASADYAHASTPEHNNASFEAVKSILEVFKTEENRIIIDIQSMRTLRDMAVKGRREYSPAYKKARKEANEALATAKARYADLRAMGVPALVEGETLETYAERVKASGVNTIGGTKAVPIDMLEMFINANKMLDLKESVVDEVKKASRWTWKRPFAVSLNEFAELVETYVLDCLTSGYNLKSSATVRAERAEARAAKKNA